MGRKSDEIVLYDEVIFKLGMKIFEQLNLPLEMIIHLLKIGKIHSFSAIVISADIGKLGDFLKKKKRKTDLLFPIDEEKEIYAMLCQETRVDGGFYFVERLKQLLDKEDGEKMIAGILGVESVHYVTRDLVFIMLDIYLQVLGDRENNIAFRTVR